MWYHCKWYNFSIRSPNLHTIRSIKQLKFNVRQQWINKTHTAQQALIFFKHIFNIIIQIKTLIPHVYFYVIYTWKSCRYRVHHKFYVFCFDFILVLCVNFKFFRVVLFLFTLYLYCCGFFLLVYLMYYWYKQLP